MNYSKKSCLAIVFFLGLWFGNTVNAQSVESYQALFIVKFMDYINFPDKGKNTNIGVMGNTKVLQELNALLKRKGNANCTVKKLGYLEEAKKYNIVFVPAAEHESCLSIIEKTASQSILIITENAALVEKGAGIGFLRENSKLRFVINNNTLQAKNIKVSSDLLKLASKVYN